MIAHTLAADKTDTYIEVLPLSVTKHSGAFYFIRLLR